MTPAQRATLEQLAIDHTASANHANTRGNQAMSRWHQDRADALRSALGTCGTCKHVDKSGGEFGFCAAPDPDGFPFIYQHMPLGERCTGWTPKSDE